MSSKDQSYKFSNGVMHSRPLASLKRHQKTLHLGLLHAIITNGALRGNSAPA